MSVDIKFNKPSNQESGILTQQFDDTETAVAYVSPVPSQSSGFLTINPDTEFEEEIHYSSKDAGAGTISGLTRDTSNLNGGTGRTHQSSTSWENRITATYIQQLVDGLLVEHTSAGYLKGQPWVEETYGATLEINMAARSKHYVTLTGNIEVSFANVVPGRVIVLKFIQDATGSRAVTFDAGITINWAGDTAYEASTDPSVSDTIVLIQTATDVYDGFIVGQGNPV